MVLPCSSQNPSTTSINLLTHTADDVGMPSIAMCWDFMQRCHISILHCTPSCQDVGGITNRFKPTHCLMLCCAVLCRQWLFLMEAIPSLLIGALIWCLLPSHPLTAWMLMPAQRELVHSRVGAGIG